MDILVKIPTELQRALQLYKAFVELCDEYAQKLNSIPCQRPSTQLMAMKLIDRARRWKKLGFWAGNIVAELGIYCIDETINALQYGTNFPSDMVHYI